MLVLLIILIAVEHDANSMQIRLNNEITRFLRNLFSINKMKQ